MKRIGFLSLFALTLLAVALVGATAALADDGTYVPVPVLEVAEVELGQPYVAPWLPGAIPAEAWTVPRPASVGRLSALAVTAAVVAVATILALLGSYNRIVPYFSGSPDAWCSRLYRSFTMSAAQSTPVQHLQYGETTHNLAFGLKCLASAPPLARG